MMTATGGGIRSWSRVFVLGAAALWGAGAARATQVLRFDVQQLGTGNGPTAVALADFDADGINDLAVANADGNTIDIFLGTGTGNGFWGTASRTLRGAEGAPLKSPQGIAAADFNGDGLPDIAVTNYNGASVVVFLNSGAAYFGYPRKVPVSANPLGIVASRLRGPAQPVELVVVAKTASTAGELTVLDNDGAANFSAVTFTNIGQYPKQVAVEDLGTAATNNHLDQKLDLAVTLQGADDAVAVLYRTNQSASDPITASSFSAPDKFPANPGPTGIAIADYNQDGCPDIAVANHQDTINKVSMLAGQCATSTHCAASGSNFSAASEVSQFGAGVHSFGLIAADLNNDAKPDLVATNSGSGGQAVLLRNGFQRGQCTPSVNVTFVSTPCTTDAGSKGLVAGSFNNGEGGDTYVDLAVANRASDDVSVLLLNGTGLACPAPPGC